LETGQALAGSFHREVASKADGDAESSCAGSQSVCFETVVRLEWSTEADGRDHCKRTAQFPEQVRATVRAFLAYLRGVKGTQNLETSMLDAAKEIEQSMT
jgi:hypothetical protein